MHMYVFYTFIIIIPITDFRAGKIIQSCNGCATINSPIICTVIAWTPLDKWN